MINRQFIYFIILLFTGFTSFAQYKTSDPFKLKIKDKCILISDSVLVIIEGGKIALLLDIDKKGRLTKWTIARVDVRTIDGNIEYSYSPPDSIYGFSSSKYPPHIDVFVPYISDKLKTLKIKRSKFPSYVKDQNIYLLTFQVLNTDY